VVGVDGSDHADAALLFAADVAAGTAAPLIVVSAYQPSAAQVAAGVVLNTVQTPGWSNLKVPALDAANEVTTGAIKTVLSVHPNLDVKEQVRQGRADGVLSTAAYGAGLLVVGSRGHGGFVGLLLGSVSQGAIHLSPCPVAVVRTVPAGAA
jgi:nucleotide-binding universal stress UspA family protein